MHQAPHVGLRWKYCAIDAQWHDRFRIGNGGDVTLEQMTISGSIKAFDQHERR